MLSPRTTAALAMLAVATGIGMASAAPLAYVPNEGSASISVIDTATDKVASTLKVGRKPRGLAISTDGSRLFASDQTANALVVGDLRSGTQIAKVDLGDSPEAVYLSPAGRWLAGAIEENDAATIVDVSALTVARKLKTNGRNPEHAIRSPDGKRVFVTSGGDGTVQVIDTATSAIVAAVPVGRRPWNMALTPDGAKLYVACGRSNAVAVIDTQATRKIADIPVGELPWGVVIK